VYDLNPQQLQPCQIYGCMAPRHPFTAMVPEHTGLRTVLLLASRDVRVCSHQHGGTQACCQQGVSASQPHTACRAATQRATAAAALLPCPQATVLQLQQSDCG
jgi:hypothetical protein